MIASELDAVQRLLAQRRDQGFTEVPDSVLRHICLIVRAELPEREVVDA